MSYSKATEWYLKYIEQCNRFKDNNDSRCFFNLGYMNYYAGNGFRGAN